MTTDISTRLSPTKKFRRIILHCPGCGRELMSQLAVDEAKKYIMEMKGEESEILSIFCEACQLFFDVRDLYHRQEWLT